MVVDKPSKNAKKRRSLALQALGERLVGLSEQQLRDMQLDEALFDAVLAATRITARGGLRRQYQLIGKLMRHVDVERIRLALESLQRQETAAKELFRRAEHWRDRIVREGHEALSQYFDATGRIDRELASLLNEYQASRGDPARKALRRKIFRRVHEDLTLQNAPG